MGQYLDLDHGTLHVKDYGGDGGSIVMVHGLGGSIANWDILGPRLTAHGHVTALDLPGFGLSPPGRDWSLETHSAAIVDAIEHTGSPAILIGNSMGGLLSEMVAAKRPDVVRALVLISPATPPRWPDPNLHWPTARRLLLGSTPGVGTAMSRRLMESMTPAELVNDSLRRITHKPGRVPIDLVESFVELAERRSRFPWAADAIPKTGQSIRALFMHRSRFVSMIRDIKAPTLVIQGVWDRIVSRTAVEWMCYLRPDWTLVMMDDTGHTPHIDAPIRTLGVIEQWLTEILGPDSVLDRITNLG
ncbi:MAG TPA: alpha/beta hydrolase [Acidimicrobiia bacterium]|jgi:pimeloyl-ACP methyl ester carboxylesterase|nr:alpha/beta hydrolase [Acidimicrobiia bacterium]